MNTCTYKIPLKIIDFETIGLTSSNPYLERTFPFIWFHLRFQGIQVHLKPPTHALS